jgi:hypothetical protein
MTIVPKPLQKPLRFCEIVFGLICVAAGCWALIGFGKWLVGSGLVTGSYSWWNAILLVGQSLYLLGFGVNLLRWGYLSMVLWAIALGILCALPVTAI